MQYDDDGNPISWLRSELRFKKDLKIGEVRIIKIRDKWSVQFKQRMPEGKKPRSIFTTETVISDKGTTSTGSQDVYEYFKKDVFSNPKPLDMIKFLLGFGVKKDDIVVDFFSGSATTAEAVMRINGVENNGIQFILVQLQENIDIAQQSSSANAVRVANNAICVLDELGKKHLITELAKERIRRAGNKIKEEHPEAKDLDTGFRVLKLDSSNMNDVYYTPAETTVDIFNQGNIKSDRTNLDLLFQVMLESNVELSAKIEEKTIGGKTVYFVEDNYLVACFDEDVTESVITEIAKEHPYYFVLRDSSMASDNVADNFEQIFRAYSPDTIRKVL